MQQDTFCLEKKISNHQIIFKEFRFQNLLYCSAFRARRTNILYETCENRILIERQHRRARIRPDKSNKLVLRRKTTRMYQDMPNRPPSLAHPHGNVCCHTRCRPSSQNLQGALQGLLVFLPESLFECAVSPHYLCPNLQIVFVVAFDNPENRKIGE